ncbi:hypothetical protein CONPUDRAFT_75579 [Coniophora puteana RWD-64-598 SS2]|uniref:Uncharacterized protein n=1 Tax=Coniophora puteana (strain RWD-64-598) TaxID=741705 RepID=A0A5M3MEY6_CONPW|nr:uncharacterized protein CONPUDRAFT_75579 [Coniophora puteana RWD-64-598 SS2]EIW77782.1 hypothetical protein CONPUDRAFT_75579 [Coniophora puteana RWD-64-598 SS2]
MQVSDLIARTKPPLTSPYLLCWLIDYLMDPRGFKPLAKLRACVLQFSPSKFPVFVLGFLAFFIPGAITRFHIMLIRRGREIMRQGLGTFQKDVRHLEFSFKKAIYSDVAVIHLIAEASEIESTLITVDIADELFAIHPSENGTLSNYVPRLIRRLTTDELKVGTLADFPRRQEDDTRSDDQIKFRTSTERRHSKEVHLVHVFRAIPNETHDPPESIFMSSFANLPNGSSIRIRIRRGLFTLWTTSQSLSTGFNLVLG